MATAHEGLLDGVARVGRSIAVTFAVLLCVASIASAQAPKTKTQLDQLIYSVKGADLYHAHCAPCHGPDAKGDGPMAAVMKMKMPDLTSLAKNNGGQFPSAKIRKTITGEDVVASHGSREMPIWGPIFHQVEDDRDFGNVRIENLVKFLEAIQGK
jgi:mono/diheme cytochrome c family protein